MYSASTLVNQTRTTIRSIVTVPARKINILSPEGDKTRRLRNILVNRVDPPGQCVTHGEINSFTIDIHVIQLMNGDVEGLRLEFYQ